MTITSVDVITSQLSKALGNRKPAVLVKVERLLWTCILQIARGSVRSFEAVQTFFNQVDWDEIAMVLVEDRAHFADGA